MPRSTGWPGSNAISTSRNSTAPANRSAGRASGASAISTSSSSTSTIRSPEAAAFAIRPVYLATSRKRLEGGLQVAEEHGQLADAELALQDAERAEGEHQRGPDAHQHIGLPLQAGRQLLAFDPVVEASLVARREAPLQAILQRVALHHRHRAEGLGGQRGQGTLRRPLAAGHVDDLPRQSLAAQREQRQDHQHHQRQLPVHDRDHHHHGEQGEQIAHQRDDRGDQCVLQASRRRRSRG